MEFTYTIMKAEPTHKILHVKYSAEGRDDFYKAFNPADWSEEFILNLINDFAPSVLAHWVYQETAANSCPIEVGVEFTANNEPAPVDNEHDHYPVPPLSTRVRMQRDVLLQETDWMVLSDSSEANTAWLDYRQALRDVPQQNTFPNVVSWPTKPV